MIAAENFATNFPLKHQQKDMRLALALGDSVGVSLPTAKVVNEQFIKGLEEHGDKDISALYLTYQDKL